MRTDPAGGNADYYFAILNPNSQTANVSYSISYSDPNGMFIWRTVLIILFIVALVVAILAIIVKFRRGWRKDYQPIDNEIRTPFFR